MTAVFIILAIMSVPLAGIASSTILKWRRLELERRGSPALEARLVRLETENRELKARVETLETIATGVGALPEGGNGPRLLGGR